MNDEIEFIRGQVSERQRVSEIVFSPPARGRERAAIELALNSTLSTRAAIRTLAEIAEVDDERSAPSLARGRK